MNITLPVAWLVSMVAAWSASAADPQLVHSFATETKLKGGFTHAGGLLYSAAEKGGDHGFGYIAAFDPSDGCLTPVHHFPKDTKVKGGFTRVGEWLYFMTEKGGPTTGFSFIGRFEPSIRVVTVVREFETNVKAKSGFAEASGLLWFATEKGGTGNGSIEKVAPDTGSLTSVAPLSLELGIKVESLAASADGRTVFAGAREGGDAAELSGKGAGSLLAIDVATGQIRKLVTFQAARHGAKLRGLTFAGEALWFIQEEGGDLQLNQGKGGGTVGKFHLTTGDLTTVHVFDGGATGFKPKGFVKTGDDFYFATEGGGAGGMGVFGALKGGARPEVLAELSAATSTKPDNVMSVVGNRLYFATELGGAHFLGGVVAFDLPNKLSAPALSIARAAEGKVQVRIQGTTVAPSVESSSDPRGPWNPLHVQPTAGADGWTFEIAPTVPAQFLRAVSAQ
jgi:hypothetical protein